MNARVYAVYALSVLLCTSLWSGCAFDSRIPVPDQPGDDAGNIGGCDETIVLPVMGTDITITAATLNGASNVAIVGPGEAVEMSIDYHIDDCACPACIDQIEIGFIDAEEFQYCAYSGTPGCDGGDSGSDTGTLFVPTQPGVYYVSFGKRQDFACGQTGGMDWWFGAPPQEHAFAAVCVTE